ncbi:AMP-binding protein, partial [Mycobacterium sp. E3298]
MLDGRDPALVALAPGSEELTAGLRVGEPIDDDVALVVTTSGTTGAPKGALLSATALTASATATHDRLGGPGRWLLALPPHHIAGLQVLVRSALAGSPPVELDVSAGFDVAELPSAIGRLGSGRRYTSLVATQLAKALTDPAAAAALAELDAVQWHAVVHATARGFAHPVGAHHGDAGRRGGVEHPLRGRAAAEQDGVQFGERGGGRRVGQRLGQLRGHQ